MKTKHQTWSENQASDIKWKGVDLFYIIQIREPFRGPSWLIILARLIVPESVHGQQSIISLDLHLRLNFHMIVEPIVGHNFTTTFSQSVCTKYIMFDYWMGTLTRHSWIHYKVCWINKTKHGDRSTLQHFCITKQTIVSISTGICRFQSTRTFPLV